MEQLKQQIVQELEKLGVKNPKLEKPPENIDADLSLPCFELAKELKKNPVGIAKELAGKLKVKNIKEVKALGPYLNFYIDWNLVGKNVLKEILLKKEKYGEEKTKENVIMDVYQANPFKSFHIGHVRNAVLGESVRRLLEFTGRKTVTVSYNGDVGTHVAKWLWYYNKFYRGKIPKENFAKWVGQIYAESSRKAEEFPEHEKEIQEVNIRLDRRDPELLKEWKKFRELCYKDFEKIAKELQVKVDYNIPESECEEPGKKLVHNLLEEGQLAKSENAIGLDMKEYGLGFFILLKSDGTALYSTKDFGLIQKKNRLCKYDKAIYVVGSEQDFYFKQLFKAFQILKIPGYGKHHHLSHGLVTLKEGKMASRLGNVILYEDLRDETVKMVLNQIEEKNSGLKNKQEAAKKIAFGAIKYSMLNIENNKSITFDWDQALDINGRSGPYLQYTYARANSILEKAGKPPVKTVFNPAEKIEVDIVKKLDEFTEAVSKAANSYSPYILANYLFELAQEFNSFYQAFPVLTAEPKIKASRLALVKTVSIVLKTGLNLLGIEELEEM